MTPRVSERYFRIHDRTGGSPICLNGVSTGEKTPLTSGHLKVGFYEIVVNGGKPPWNDQLELTPDKIMEDLTA